jgi:hypothetical protein
MPKNKKTTSTEHCRYPIPNIPQYDAMMTQAAQNVAAVKACSDYPNQPEVQACTGKVSTAIDGVKTTLVDLGKAQALVGTLETQLINNGFALLLANENMQSTVDVVCAGDVTAIKNWGGDVGTQTTTYEPTTAAPNNVRASSRKLEGDALVRCQADPRAFSYYFQMGNTVDPTNWAAPMELSSSMHHFTGLPSHTRVYFRMAIMRRQTGMSAWSDVVSVVIK